MQISGGRVVKEDYKSNKTSKILLVCIVIAVLAIMVVLGVMIYLQQNVFRIYIDGKLVQLEKDTIIIEDTGKIYIDIKGIAKYLGYDSHNGEYKLYTEDVNKCYVDSENETASFFLNSNKISKMAPDQTQDYEDYVIDDPVISKDGKLYCSPEGIKIGFNVTFDYDEEKNRIQIYTLPYLVEYYDPIIKKYGYEGVSENFNNQKAILYDMFVVRKEKGLYGVVTLNNKEIISSKYSKMNFNENAQEFYVTSTTNKVGIVNNKSETKINLLYDEIKMLDKEAGLYVVKSNGKYGVLDENGSTIIHLEYDSIGVDTTKFASNNISNKYLLFDNAIPVYQNKKWGLFDTTGKLIVPVEFDYIGYTSGSNNKVVNNLLIIPSYKAIVLGKDMPSESGSSSSKDRKYTIYDFEGNEIVPCVLDTAYSVTSGGVDTYYMDYYDQKDVNIEKYIEKLYELQGKTKPTVQNTDTIDNTSSTISNEISE